MWVTKNCRHFLRHKRFCIRILARKRSRYISYLNLPEPEYDLDFLCNPANRDIINANIKARKGVGNIDKVLELSQKPELKEKFLKELSLIPNQTDPTVLSYEKEPQLLKEHGCKRTFYFEPKEFSELAKNLKIVKSENMGPVIGQRGYIFVGDLANLEEALVHYTVNYLMKHGFKLISVPDILPSKVIERCGLITDKGRPLTYNLISSSKCYYSLSGTAEMALAYKVMNSKFHSDDLPLRMAAVSRCFRAEVSHLLNERGLYRVHQFTKVEMFVCSKRDESEEEFQKLQEIQENLFSSLNLHFQVIDMPPHDLGAPAYRKVDIEGWMPGRKLYGELSSCSNCTDYQSRRLNIKYTTKEGELLHVHTLNATACAIPRMIIALCETYQTKHQRIEIPEVLVPYMNTHKIIKQPIADMRTYKYTPNVR